jgi:tetratricopeptide (TPR) repeat protein
LSGAKDLASKALVAASRIAADRFDYATALDLATEAIGADDTADARIQRATVQLRLTHFEAAHIDTERAISSDADARSLEVAGSVAYYRKDFERAAALGDALIQQASGATQRVQGQVIRARALHAIGDVPGADELLTRAMATCRKQRLRPPTSVYAFLKVHTGEIRLALSAIETSPYAAADAVSTIYTPVHGYAAHGYALATSGRAAEALAVLERATVEARRRGLTRYESLSVNLGAWVLRNIGEPEHARESNEVALAGARETAYRELEVYATLDPCEDFIEDGNAVAANTELERAHELMDDVYAYRWRHELRVDLLQGRMALLRGDAGAALTIAAGLMTMAAERHAPRYVQLGTLLHLQARAALGDEPPSPGALADLSSSLSTIAGIEVWWLMADLGASLRSDVCFAYAQSHRDRLAARLDEPRRGAFLRYAGTRLESTRTRGHTA